MLFQHFLECDSLQTVDHTLCEKLIAHCTHKNNPLVRITDGTVDIVLRATLIANVRAELGILGADQTGDASECKKRLANLLKGSTKETSGNSKVTETQPESKNKDSDIDTKEALSPDTRKNIRFLVFDLTTDHVHVRESLTHTEINQVLDFHMGKELNFLRGDREAGSTALAEIVSNMLETEEDKEDTHVAFYFLNGECTGIRITHLDLSLEPDTIKSDVCILLGLDKHNSSGSESTEPTIQLCDTLKAKWKAANTTATSLSHCTTQETRTWATPITATPEGREMGSQNKDDAKELLEELVEAKKEIQRQNNYIASKRELWKKAMTRSTGLLPSTAQELIALMSKKQLTLEIHRLGADYPVKSDQKTSKKAAIKLLRKLLKEEYERQGPLNTSSKGTEETEITRLTTEVNRLTTKNKRLHLYVETINRERKPPKVTYAIDVYTQTTPDQEVLKQVSVEGEPAEQELDKGPPSEEEDTSSQKEVGAETSSNTAAQADPEEWSTNDTEAVVSTPELEEGQEEEKHQEFTPTCPDVVSQPGHGTPADLIEVLQQH